jgi:hypothetical protein
VLDRPQGDFPDAEIVLDGRRIGVEVAEIVDPKHAKNAPYSATRTELIELIATPVRKKIARRYDRGGYETLWLLVWESYPYALRGDTAGAVYAASDPKSPFDELWLCHITGDNESPDVERWWPFRPVRSAS